MMKMIEVFDLMAKGEIKEGTKLKIYYNSSIYTYKYREIYKLFLDDDDEYRRLEQDFEFDEVFLNFVVDLIPPKPKKYYLRLDEDDSFSYINMTMYAAYEAATKDEIFGYNKTKFTQEEIDNDVLLKFIEKYGIKEEVE